MAHTKITNRLSAETSLYLRQHADNPVAWQPWDNEALALARETGRPILLSIGYSACHWCHVMAHESFEDAETAKVMNELYINIKVDREERPDLDKIYQLSHQLLTGRGGGWPLTLFLDPVEQIPFFAGTYFPLQPRYGMPAFREVLVRARQWFDQNPDDVRSQADRLQGAIEAIQQPPAPTPGNEHENGIAARAAEHILSRFDSKHGGFGGAPKFPQAPLLELVEEIGGAALPEAGPVLTCLDTTLEKMAASGLRDHLDGGFFRYCVDETWTIPHFEKMLYDNAQLLPLYARAAARTGRESLRNATTGIVGWLKAEMLQANGAWSASIDADADGEEGGFHAWTTEEARQLLSEEAWAAFARAYGLDGPPNFEGKAWHLVGKVESDNDDPVLKEARRILHTEREKRVHPTLDQKQLTSWNALTAAGLITAGRVLDRPGWIEPGQATLDFIRNEMWKRDGLLAVYNQGEARFCGYLDDYAFTLEALIESLKTCWRHEDLDFAMALADSMLDRFEDTEHGGFYFSDNDQPTPIARTIAAQDDATPSAYARAINALHDLAGLVGEARYLESAGRALARALPGIGGSVLAFPGLITASMRAEKPRPQLVIKGHDTSQCESLKQWAETHFPVNCYFVRSAGEEKQLPGILAEFHGDQPVTAWLCLGMKCLPPVNSPGELQALLEQQG